MSIILLDGTSSSGKTSICFFYDKLGFKRIPLDDYPHSLRQKLVYEELPNEYFGPNKILQATKLKARELMALETTKYSNVVIDDVEQYILKYIPRNKVYVVIVYTSLEDLVRNILNRKNTDPRSTFVFDQFAEKYVKLESENDSIDILNRQKFILALKKISYEFENEQELNAFAEKIFSFMNIEDDVDHYIGLRSGIEYDQIINTTSKSPIEIFTEIEKARTKNTPQQSFAEIICNTLTGHSHRIQIDLFTETIGDLTKKVSLKEGIKCNNGVKLLYANKNLQPSELVSSYGIGHGSQIHAVLNLRGD